MLSFIQFLAEELPEYLYHATNTDNIANIKDSKKLITHKPSFGTEDQSSWPDGSTKKRSYFSHSEDIAKNFHPEGKPAMLRIKTALHPHFKNEKYTKDYYTEKHIPSKHFEIKGEDGNWKNLHV